MQANHLISIIIPSYNYGLRLPQTLESLRHQADERVEILVIDDGSTDNTASVVTTFQALNPWTKLSYLYQNNKGAAAARNAGIKAASGSYLLFLDADDYLLPNALTLFRRAILFNPHAAMIAAGHLSFHENTQTYKKHFFKKSLTTSNETNFLYYLRKKISLGAGAMLYKRQVFETIKFPESVKNTEDISVFFQVLATQSCSSIPEPVVIYNKHDTSLRHQFSYHQAAGLKIADLIFDETIMPRQYLKYKNEYLSLRNLSLSRIAYKEKNYTAAVDYYKHAIKNYPLHVIKVSYFKKYLFAQLQIVINTIFKA